MLKKICSFIIALLCFVPTISFANDAGPILDTERKLSIELELKSHEAEIGGTLDFTLTLTNNTAKPMNDYLLLHEIFMHTPLTEDIHESLKNLPELNAGEKVVLFLSASVPQNVYWYKKGSSYYTDFRLFFEYYAWEINGDDIDDGWETSYYYESEPTPIKLTNLFDGTDILKLESDEKENAFYFGEDLYSGDDKYDLASRVHSQTSTTNLSLYQLSNVVIRKENGYNTEILQVDVINPSQVYTQDLIYNQYIDKSNLPSKIFLEIKAIFTLNNKYYASWYSKELPTQLIDFPEVDVNVQPDPNNGNNNLLTIKNTSGSDYEDFYVDFHDDDPYTYYTNNFIETFDKNKLLEFSLAKPKYSYYHFIVGYIQDNSLFTWQIDINSNMNKIEFIKFQDVIDMENNEIIASPTPSPPPTASPKPTASPTLKATQTPTPTHAATPSPAPTPTITALPSPMPSQAALPTSAITVNSITKKPAFSTWVWIAFACALFATGTVSVLLHIHRSNTHDK